MLRYRSILWLNALCLFIVLALLAYTKFINPSAGALFMPPPSPNSPTEGLLTNVFQLLCTVPPLVCAFSFTLINKINTPNKNHKFIFYSAILTLGFLINEEYRIHILILQLIGIPKLVTIVIYALIGLYYGISFRRAIIKSTPYPLLLVGLGLLIAGVSVDLLHLRSSASTPLEGLPKLFSGINVALYYWLVCYTEVVNSFKGLPKI